MKGGLYLGHSTLPYLSALRIYQPLASFTESEQTLIRRSAPPKNDRILTDIQELADSFKRTMIAWPSLVPAPAAERVRSLSMSEDSAELFNISQIRLRTVQALTELSSGPSRELSELLFSPDFVEQVQTGFSASQPSMTRTSSWGIPFSWFMLVSEGDRTELVESRNTIVTVRVQVPLAVAAGRAAHAVELIERAAPELDILEDIRSLRDWLANVEESGALELDYGAVADRVYPDESPLDMRMGLEAVAEGDLVAAAAAYRRLVTRWTPIRQLAQAS